jgi:hypothetical protein
MFDICATSGRENMFEGTFMFACIMTYAHKATIRQYASVERSMLTAASCAFCLCNTGVEGYTLAKKKSRHVSTSPFGRRPCARANVVESVRPSKPTSGGNPAASWALRWFSRSSESTFALLPLGPFFCGMALYVQASPAERQFLQGFVPSPIHLTLRRWQLYAQR